MYLKNDFFKKCIPSLLLIFLYFIKHISKYKTYITTFGRLLLSRIFLNFKLG